jgi:hypothetical protein
MNPHPYLRAYMAGIVVPTLLLIVAATAFCMARYVYNVPIPIERVIVFPMAAVPNLWGLWNILFVGSHTRTHLSLGLHGALLPLLLGPLGFLLVRILDINTPDVLHGGSPFPLVAPLALIAYYLVWKYIVGFLNRLVGLA